MLSAATCFSGIGAPELGGPEFNWLWSAEIEPFPSAVLAARHPDSENLGDVLADDFIERAKAKGKIDLLAGGPPCQGFSIAGLRGGMSDPRGNLTLRWVQILHAIRPRNAVTENVPGWLSMPDNAFGCFLAGLVGADAPLLPADRGEWYWKHEPLFLCGEGEESTECASVGGQWQWTHCRWPSVGMVAGPRARAAWRIFDAQYFGVAQRRRRVFVVADFGEGANPAEILFEPRGMQGNNPPSREAGKGIAADVAPSVVASGTGTQSTGESRGQDPVVAERVDGAQSPAEGLDVVTARMTAFGEYECDGTASTIKARDHKDATDLVACAFKPSHYTRGKDGAPSDVSPPLTADADKGDQDAVVCAPEAYSIMPMNSGKDYKARKVDVSQPVMTKPVGGNQGGDFVVQPPIAIQAGALRENPNSGPDGVGVKTDGTAYTIEARAEVQAVAFTQNTRDEVRYVNGDGSICGTLMADAGMKQQNYIQQNWAVRRLTPVECARLQDFPDTYLDIQFRNKPAADSNKYKSLGNSWAVPCGRWILNRIAKAMEAST